MVSRIRRSAGGMSGPNAPDLDAQQSDRSDTVRVRMTVDLVGPLADELEKTAQKLGKSKTDLVRDGLAYVFRALRARNDGYFVGAWKEDPDGKVERAREFAIGN